MDKKTDAPKGSALNAKKPAAPASSHAFVDETDAMHDEALAEIRARGEDPTQILSAMASMKAKLRERYLAPAPAAIPDDALVMPNFNDDPSAWGMGDVIFFEESVAAGISTPGGDSLGRPTEISDLMKGFDPSGKLLFTITCFPAASTHLDHGDQALVDPNAKLRDGNLVLAEWAGHGQAVLRVRMGEAGESIFDSDIPGIPPINASQASGLRIHGRILWRSHPIR